MAKVVGVIMLDNSTIVGDITIDEDMGYGAGALYGGPVTGWVGRGDGAPRFGRGGDGRGRGGHHPGRGGRGGSDPSGRDRFPDRGGGSKPRHDEPEWHPADPKFRRKRPGQQPESEAPHHEGSPGHKGVWGPEDPGTPAPGWRTDKHGRPIYGHEHEDPPKPRTDEPAPDGSSESEGAYEGLRQGPGDMHEAWSEGLQPGERRPASEEDPPKPKTDEDREAEREAHRGAHREKEKGPPLRGLAPPKTEPGEMQRSKGWAPPRYTDVVTPGAGVGEDATAANVPVQPEGDSAPRMGVGGPGDLDRQAFDRMYGSTPLAGKFDRITDLARQHGIPPALFGAIITQETGRGTSAALRDKNNPAGISGAGPPVTFPDLDAGLSRSAEVIAKHWRSAHENIDELAEIYSPTKNATNDPGNLNRFWPSGVRRFMAELGVPGKAGPIAAYDMPTGFGPSAASTAEALPVFAQLAAPSGNYPSLARIYSGQGAMGQVEGLVLHHTSVPNRGDPQQIVNGNPFYAQWVMDREGNVFRQTKEGQVGYHFGGAVTWNGKRLTNANMEGLEVMARDESDYTEAQKQALGPFIGWHSRKHDYDPMRFVIPHGVGPSRSGMGSYNPDTGLMNPQSEAGRQYNWLHRGELNLAPPVTGPPQSVAADLESIDSILNRVYGPGRNK
jgi:hypothetical protein